MQYINVDIMFSYYTYSCFLKNMIRQNSIRAFFTTNKEKYSVELFHPYRYSYT